MRALLTSSLSLAAILLVPPAFADPNCQGQLTRDLHRNDAGTYDAKAGTIADYLHLDSVDEDGKPQTYAQHGGGIYPADAINLLNCRLVKIRNDDGRGYRFYIVLNNTAANANEIIRSGVEQKLVEAGLNHADASNASQAYIEHPESACGKAAKSILSGATELVDVISDNGICQME